MHIGTARTALFNYLFARHHNGVFLVRIEDTDKERSTAENTDFIKDAFNWLSLEPDEDYTQQSHNQEAHIAAAHKLLNEGKAYKDGDAIRFTIPAGSTTWTDLIQGEITVQHTQLEDFVLLRSDGTPTYHLGVVADDAAQQITHVIRGDDHINNTPKQILLYQALGYTVPAFAHVPLIHGPDGAKLSKRHGAASVQEYRDAGYLADALSHYLMMLSWLPGDHNTPITLDVAAQQFNLKDVKKGPASFDAAKLESINNLYLRELDNAALITALVPFYPTTITGTIHQRLSTGLSDLKSRAKTLPELATAAAFYADEAPFTFDEKSQAAIEQGQPILRALTSALATSEWTRDALDNCLATFVESQEIKFKHLGMPLRAALTGHAGGPSVVGIMLALGKQETLSRLELVK